MIHRRAFVALATALSGTVLPRGGQAQQQGKGNLDGWGPFKFGMGVDAAKAVAPDTLIPENPVNSIYRWWYRTEIEGISTKATLYFMPFEGALRLGRIMLQMDSLNGEGAAEKYQFLIERMKERYGQPDEDTVKDGALPMLGKSHTRIFRFDNDWQVYFSADEKAENGRLTYISYIVVEYGPVPAPSRPMPKSTF